MKTVSPCHSYDSVLPLTHVSLSATVFKRGFSICYVVSLIRSRKTDIQPTEVAHPTECRNIIITFTIRSQLCANGLVISRFVGDKIYKQNVSLLTVTSR